MDLDEAIRRRRMCRSFLEEPVPPDVVDRLLDRARRAPSAGHSQGWAFVVLEGPEQTGRFWALDADPGWLARPSLPGVLRAPVIVLPLCNRQVYRDRYQEPDKLRPGPNRADLWPVPYWIVDAAMATMLLLLGAVAEGLGALFFALHNDPEATLSGLGVPAGWQALGAVALGWPAPEAGPRGSARRPRAAFEDIVHRGGW
ncbi:MAG: nitroreductase family protein [Acidimicrobiales bacterium]